MAASLLRLHFHDCFVNGCDGSILLDSTPTFKSEKTALPNKHSVRGYVVIDKVKAALESACPGMVSCADILALAARDAVMLSGGPYWKVLLGRRDSLNANQTAANDDLPSPLSTVAELAEKFAAVGLSIEDMITLSGSHTIGKARCITFRDRLFNHKASGMPDPAIQSDFLTSLQSLCPTQGNNDTLAVLDVQSPVTFDNGYYKNLVRGQGLLDSDELLYTTPGITRNLVIYYLTHQQAFFEKFAIAMQKLGNIKLLTGPNGEIRKNCRLVNNYSY